MNPKKQWAREDNLNELLSLLRQHTELRFSDLREKLGVSEPTLTEYIVKLEKELQIEAFSKPEDRRKKWYRIKPESNEEVEARLNRYEAIKFIEEMIDPVHAHKQKGSRSASAFAYTPNEKDRETLRKAVERIASWCVKFPMVPIPKGSQIALVLTAQGGENAK